MHEKPPLRVGCLLAPHSPGGFTYTRTLSATSVGTTPSVRAMQQHAPARMNLRMAPALKEGLQEAALAAGVSLNAYIVQVLAAAAGQRANFLDLHSPGSSANMD